MKIVFEELGNGEEEEIVIRCANLHQLSPGVLRLLDGLKAEELLVGYKGNEIHKIKAMDVYYFEAVENRTFLYRESEVLEVKQRLYELEKSMGTNFQRISKSVIMNLDKLQWITPALNGRFEAFLKNGERVIVSRQYVSVLKKKLGV